MLVYDAEAERVREVSTEEARAGMLRYARSLGRGTPACGVYERRAVALEPEPAERPSDGR